MSSASGSGYTRSNKLDIRDLFECGEPELGKEYPMNLNKLIHAFPRGFHDWPVEIEVNFTDTIHTVKMNYSRLIRSDIYLKDKKIYVEGVEFEATGFKILMITVSPVWIQNTFI
jgi:hypothetical protein